MAINQELLGRLQKKLGVGRARIYAILKDLQLRHHISGHVATLLLASQNSIAYGKYAEPEDREELRAASRNAAPVIVEHAVERSAKPSKKLSEKTAKKTRDNSIFVVHGRDLKLRDSMYAFLRSIGLFPMEWDHAIAAAKGGANPIIGDVIGGAMQKAQGVLVLLSPDEDAKLNAKLASTKDKKKGLTKLERQPRPNVIFEAGLALGAHSDKTILVQVGDIREISDIAGKHMVHLDNSTASRNTLAQRLEKKLKFKINLVASTWMSAGDFKR